MSDEKSDDGEFDDIQPLHSMHIEMAGLLADQEVPDSDLLASILDSTSNASDAIAIGMDDDLQENTRKWDKHFCGKSKRLKNCLNKLKSSKAQADFEMPRQCQMCMKANNMWNGRCWGF